jgi:Fe-S cluster assembly protein SufD
MTLVASKKMDSFLSKLSFPSNTVQQDIIEQLNKLDFPTPRDEYWKYTRVGKIANTAFKNDFESLAEIDISAYVVSDNYILIENGEIRQDLSQFNTDFGISFDAAEALIQNRALSENLDKNVPFTTLNAGLFRQAISISVAPKQAIKNPLQLIYVSHGENINANNRLIIEAGKFSSAEIIITEVSLNANGCFGNTVSEINLADNAKLTIHKIQTENDSNLHVSTEEVNQAQNSTFKINTFTFGGLLVRNNINIAVSGENCETYMNGAVITEGKQHVDNHTYVNHKVPHCYSNENYKYVLDDQSTGVFNGKVIVQKDAQVINAYQNNGNILLSEKASINSKPELEIYADDVKCSHGSTTGQLDEDALFYLETRGISKANARKLLVSAFVGEVIESTENEKITTLLYKLLNQKYGWDF